MAETPENEQSALPEGEGTADEGQRTERFKDLEVLQQEVEKRIRDNRRFLERFLDEDFDEEDDPDEDEEEAFEEL